MTTEELETKIRELEAENLRLRQENGKIGQEHSQTKTKLRQYQKVAAGAEIAEVLKRHEHKLQPSPITLDIVPEA